MTKSNLGVFSLKEKVGCDDDFLVKKILKLIWACFRSCGHRGLQVDLDFLVTKLL